MIDTQIAQLAQIVRDLQNRIIELEVDASWMPKEANPRRARRMRTDRAEQIKRSIA